MTLESRARHDKEELFELWAPQGRPWSVWAKPVLFAQMGADLVVTAPDAPMLLTDYFWLPEADGRTALVIDLPALDAIAAGLALLARGYQPVPLFNTSIGPGAVIDAESIARALARGGDALRGHSLPADAPPAFLVDANRAGPERAPSPGQFDNRWVVFPQDFPSAAFLAAKQIAQVIVLMDRDAPRDDLAHALLRWQQGGIQVLAASPTSPGQLRPMTVRPTSRVRGLWLRLLIAAGLRRNSAGGFGGIVPRPGSGG
jgi:hypothetical protein